MDEDGELTIPEVCHSLKRSYYPIKDAGKADGWTAE
jgi:hypothetical protein